MWAIGSKRDAGRRTSPLAKKPKGSCTRTRGVCGDADCANCFPRSFAAYADSSKVACWSARNELLPRQVAFASNKKYWFQCDGNCGGHDFSSALYSITGVNQSWCPYCAGQQLCEDADCAWCFDRSFAAFADTAKVACWSKRNLWQPRQFALASRSKCWFQCDGNCGGHHFLSALNHITSAEGCWCPYCAGRQLCEDADCAWCFDRSFAAFADTAKVACWSERNPRQPRQVELASNKKFWFQCDGKCGGHHFSSALNSITGANQRWCPYCAGQQLCEDADCTWCFDRSFAAFVDTAKVACWSDRNSRLPRQVAMASGDKYWFQCDGNCGGHDFSSALNSITGANQSWCPYCAGRQLCEDADCAWCFDRSFAAFADKAKDELRRGHHKTPDGPMCHAHYIRSPHATTQQRAKISLEMHFIASMELVCKDRPGGYTWAEPSSWDCAVLPGLAFKPDLMWAFDADGNIFSTTGACKLSVPMVRVIILEVLEVGIAQHSAARTVSDIEREARIRGSLTGILVDFVYVTVAAYKHPSAHPDDKFFAKGCATDPEAGKDYEYHVVPCRQAAWEARVRAAVEALDRANGKLTGATVVHIQALQR
ncbi:hypothetical protein JKP88DRAFT_273108 [Tribonema minus]|uniref:Treble clef zinc finger domain-containing protein n=1 Tax=Tribonema minus TaxID=303371 RepID=A0A836CE59_9STRA|nr:hypothetical protein JKP88DRAFT_273108 [Tribonema minus]